MEQTEAYNAKARMAEQARMQAPYIGEVLEERPPNQVQEGIIKLDKIISTIQNTVNTLSDRLYPVLRAKSTEAAIAEKTPPGEIIVPLADDLRNLYNEAAAANEDLRSILNRLEL